MAVKWGFGEGPVCVSDLCNDDHRVGGTDSSPACRSSLNRHEGMWVQFLVYKGRSHGPNWALVVGLTSVFSPILHSGAFLTGPERMLPGQVPRRPQYSRPEQPSKRDLRQSSTSFPRAAQMEVLGREARRPRVGRRERWRRVEGASPTLSSGVREGSGRREPVQEQACPTPPSPVCARGR